MVQLLDAAVACLREEGLEGLTLERVSRRCGTSIALISRYFESRSGLIAAIYRHMTPDLPVPQTEGIRTEAAAVAAILDFIGAHFDTSYYAAENLPVWTAVFSAVRSHPRVAQEYAEGESMIADQMVRLLDILGEVRGVPLDSMRISKTFLALLDGLWMQHSMMPDYLSQADARAYALAYIRAEIGLPV